MQGISSTIIVHALPILTVICGIAGNYYLMKYRLDQMEGSLKRQWARVDSLTNADGTSVFVSRPECMSNQQRLCGKIEEAKANQRAMADKLGRVLDILARLETKMQIHDERGD